MLSSSQTQRIWQTGYYGKVPGRGDFVCNHLPRGFVDPWDAWLQRAIASSRNCLLDGWLDTYLTSPIWCYYLSPGVCDSNGWIGVLMPSVDKVGRYFPLTMACSVPASVNPFELMASKERWFAETETLMLAILEDNLLELNEFDRQVRQLNTHFDESLPNLQETAGWDGILGAGPHWRLPLNEDSGPMASCTELSRQMLAARFSTYSLWWSNGSDQVSPSLLVSAGLPAAESFSALLDGRWQAGSWEEWLLPAKRDSQLSNGNEQAQTSPISIDQILQSERIQRDNVACRWWHSSAGSDVGKIRTVNEDAYLNLPEVGLWAVADGMGGHAAGELASAMTVDALSNLGRTENLNDFVNDVTTCLQRVNRSLLQIAHERSVSTIGCTVVVLMMIERRAAFIWAGDSRVYLSRDGELMQLTRDHSYETDEPTGVAINATEKQLANMVTRAVGAASELEVEVGYVELIDGDCFLLCSDGLNKEVTAGEIDAILRCGDESDATRKLLDLSLARGARDNVTVVTVQLSATDETRNNSQD